MSALTIGQKKTAILIWLGPVQSACGIISPKANTPVTDRIIATYEGTSRSRHKGRASTQTALQSKSVTSIQWCLSITGKIFSVARFASGLAFASISRPNLSIEASPTVSPDIKPLDKIRKIVATEYIDFDFVDKEAAFADP
jgi:hypothetical protein